MIELGLVVFLYFFFWFLIGCLKSRNDIVDTAWGPGFVLGALYCVFKNQSQSVFSQILLGMLVFWAFRLSIYIYFRNRGKAEDFRYRKWREEWGRWFYLRSFLQVYMLQGFFLLVIGIPVWSCLLFGSGVLGDSTSSLLFLAGLKIWLLGFLVETISDLQMARFKKSRQASQTQTVMMNGLWKYSRHPNYFGECVLWWGIYLVCVSLGAPYWTLIGPLTLTFLLVKVSGVPMLESKYKENKEYQDYQARTSSFVPWLPKKA